ncbi:UNVERIFIED_CONTAM: WEB family protein [Sesamum angustifolium]|uniref:WEB family protein n=1 Tax=Sesamum angustifolium TaxID=2727405 RepID=A0AAW2NK86_9LAMI
MQGEEGLVVRGRVEIDTRQPFRSVREAVMLFGEKILAGEVYGDKLKEMQSKASNGQNQPSKLGAVTAELEETKQSLEKAKQEGSLMAHCLTSLRQELEQTKRELHQLKAKKTNIVPHLDIDEEPEIEELKFVENTSNVEITVGSPGNDEDGLEFEKKRSVKFASPPLLTKVIVSKDSGMAEDGERAPLKSKKKMKKNPLVPLIGGFFLKKIKGRKESES